MWDPVLLWKGGEKSFLDACIAFVRNSEQLKLCVVNITGIQFFVLASDSLPNVPKWFWHQSVEIFRQSTDMRWIYVWKKCWKYTLTKKPHKVLDTVSEAWLISCWLKTTNLDRASVPLQENSCFTCNVEHQFHSQCYSGLCTGFLSSWKVHAHMFLLLDLVSKLIYCVHWIQSDRETIHHCCVT